MVVSAGHFALLFKIALQHHQFFYGNFRAFTFHRRRQRPIVGGSFKEVTPRNQSIKFNIYTPASDQSARRRGSLETVVRECSSQSTLEPLAQSAGVNHRWSFECHIIHVHAALI